MHRNALKTGDKLSLRNTQTNEIINLEITAEPLGRGGSCIVYEARSDGTVLPCKYRLKELYPENIAGIYRNNNNQLVINDECYTEYAEAKNKFEKALEFLWEFAYSDTTGCYAVCPLGKFEGICKSRHSALYLLTQWMPSDYVDTVNLCGSSDLITAVQICLKTAYAAIEFHKMGYINLDIKPENILYSPKTNNIAFFDTDTIFRKNDTPGSISFSYGAAPEIVNGYSELYSEKSDVFSIGSMLHRFITKENYFPGQYSLVISQNHNDLEKYNMLKYASPQSLSAIQEILAGCNQGNPSKRISMAELTFKLEQLTDILSSSGHLSDSEAFNNDEITGFALEMNKMQKADTILKNFYVILFLLSVCILLTLTFTLNKFSINRSILCIIFIFIITILKAIILKRSEHIAISAVKEKNCRKHYKNAFSFGSSLNNHQLFEISAPGFIPPTEKKRHHFRIISGSAAIFSGAVTALISVALNSFPFLVAAWAIILALVFGADYAYSAHIINKMYNARFGSAQTQEKKNINEIYRLKYKNNKNKPEKLSSDCIRMIIYNEYKTRCNRWGIIDVISKLLAVVNMLLLLIQLFSFPVSSYFRMPDNVPYNVILCTCILLFTCISLFTVLVSRSFYFNIKDILFSVNCSDNTYLSKKIYDYSEMSLISDISYARGIYNFALTQFERGINILDIPEPERPTFNHYCISQNARVRVYLLLLTISFVCIIVWHLKIYYAFIPILSISILFQLWWYNDGVYIFNKLFWGIKTK